MKKNKLWLIPAAFFAACSILNLVGCLSEGQLERIVKPALMPLLCLSSTVWLLGRTEECNAGSAALLMLGQLFGFAGDTMLIGKGFGFFVGGMGLFLAGHICYICLFGSRSLRGLKAWQWAAGLACCALAAAALTLIIGIKGVMLAPMGIYGFTLMVLFFSCLCGLVREGGETWWILLAGAVLFTFSDALIAVRNFGSLSPFLSGFGVMVTYLAAQSLIAVGGLRLSAFPNFETGARLPSRAMHRK